MDPASDFVSDRCPFGVCPTHPPGDLPVDPALLTTRWNLGKTPNATITLARPTNSFETGRGGFADVGIPASRSRPIAAGLVSGPGRTPALSARHPLGALALKTLSAITLRNVLPVQTKRTVPTGPGSDCGEKKVSNADIGANHLEGRPREGGLRLARVAIPAASSHR